MTATLISRVSAAILLAAGITLLFAPDVVLPRLIPDYPTAALWFGQLLGAAWLGAAALNWLSRSAVLGGIYGRPVVLANLALYFVSALAILRAASRASSPGTLWVLAVPPTVLTVAYGALLVRGPPARDLDARSAS